MMYQRNLRRIIACAHDIDDTRRITAVCQAVALMRERYSPDTQLTLEQVRTLLKSALTECGITGYPGEPAWIADQSPHTHSVDMSQIERDIADRLPKGGGASQH